MRGIMKVLKFVSVLSLTVLATACGNTTRSADDLRTNNWGTTNPNSTVTTNNTRAQGCSGTPNVISPQAGYQSSFAFSACKSNQSLRIVPADGNTRNVCVFPVNAYNGMVSPLVYPNYGSTSISQFFVQCTQISNSAGAVSFGTAQYNGVYIVDQAVAPTFAQCMSYGDIRTCAQASGIVYAAGFVQ